jgi:hypothetical protein
VLASKEKQLAELLGHPSVWRGRSRAQIDTVSTGFTALDAGLPGGGWPRAGLVEVLTTSPGVGELYLLMPVLAALSHLEPARWCAWVSPPHEPFAPGLVAHGVALDRVLVVRTATPLWAEEQALRSGACEAALVWLERASPRAIRRLQLAAEQGRTLGVMFRNARFAQESSPASLRVALEPIATGARITLVKSRGGAQAPIDVHWADRHVS